MTRLVRKPTIACQITAWSIEGENIEVRKLELLANGPKSREAVAFAMKNDQKFLL